MPIANTAAKTALNAIRSGLETAGKAAWKHKIPIAAGTVGFGVPAAWAFKSRMASRAREEAAVEKMIQQRLANSDIEGAMKTAEEYGMEKRAFIGAIGSLLGRGVGALSNVARSGMGAMKSFAGAAKADAKPMMNAFASKAKAIAPNTTAAMGNAGSKAMSAMGNMGSRMSSLGSTIGSKMKAYAPNLTAFAGNVGSKMKAFAGNVGNAFANSGVGKKFLGGFNKGRASMAGATSKEFGFPKMKGEFGF